MSLIRDFRGAALLALGCCLASSLAGCAVLHREISTPVRGVVSEENRDPPPPKDLVFVAVKEATIPPKTRDGRVWDSVGGSAPDVYAVLFVDEKEVLRTVTVPNTLRPVWPPPTPVNLRIPHSAKVRVELWDDNALVPHPICNQSVHNLDEAADAGETEVECDSGATVVLTVQEPKGRLGIGLFYELRGKDVFVSRVVAESSAGRAGLRTGDQLMSADGRAIAGMTDGELTNLFNVKGRLGVSIEVRGADGETRRSTLRDEPMYPVKGEGIELLVDPAAANPD
jgi:hypothetical protein